MRCHELAGAVLVKSKLRILVEIVAQRDDFIEIDGDSSSRPDRRCAEVLTMTFMALSAAPQALAAFPCSTSPASAA